MRSSFPAWLVLVLFSGCVGAPAGGDPGDSVTEVEPVEVLEETVGFPDATPPDVPDFGFEDTGTECVPGTGCFGEPCGDGDDCLSGLCGPHLGDPVCTQTCEIDCPTGWDCALVSSVGADPIFICVSRFTHLCRPCTDTMDCASDGSENACVSYGAEGHFCGATCGPDALCPEGYLCEERDTASGGTSAQCVASAGVCACSETATNLGLATPCAVENEFGACDGVRACGPEGLGACDAQVPGSEICDGLDNDCDGVVDGVFCDDGNPCTEDSCLGADGCQHTDLDGVECLDGDACTQVDHCELGVCVGTLVVCDDANPCTDDVCDSATGCSNTANFDACDDKEPCTFGDTCKEGVCVSGPWLVCFDGNTCTADSCDDELGCVFEPLDEPCDDGNPCTLGDSCASGVCKGPALIVCDDTNQCTTDSCNPLSGCSYQPHNLPCDDGNVCTVGDFCQAGGCKGGLDSITCDDGNPCTTDACDAVAGCKFLHNDAACSDGSDCTVDDTCVAGACLGVGALTCDDGNPCTVDLCLPDQGCSHVPTAAPCSDGDLCTLGDTCEDGSCFAGTPQNCDDQNPCTDDSCGEDGLCVHTPNAALCDDANACTTGDACQASMCVGAAIVKCDDDNVCTTDSCSPVSGCANEPNALACDDGNACSVNDQCAVGTCISGTPKYCFDGNPCTNDSCLPATGCKNVFNTSACDDNIVCTEDDVCSNGACFGSWIPGCQ
jgi:hypothetical protein